MRLCHVAQIIQDYASSGSAARRTPQMAASMHVTRGSEQQFPHPPSSSPMSAGTTHLWPHFDLCLACAKMWASPCTVVLTCSFHITQSETGSLKVRSTPYWSAAAPINALALCISGSTGITGDMKESRIDAWVAMTWWQCNGTGAGILRAAPASMQQQQQLMLRRHSWSTHGLRNALNAMQQPAGGVQASPSLPATPLGGTEAARHAFAAPGTSPSPSPHERGGYLNRLATHAEADEVCCLSQHPHEIWAPLLLAYLF